MLDRQQAFHLARLICKAIPNMPGKLRIARFALRPFRKMGQQAGATQAFLHSLGYRTFRLGRRTDAGAPVYWPLATGSAMLVSQRFEA